MKTTEEMLLEVHNAPVIKLADVCEKYLGIKHYQARVRAARNGLPFPAFKAEPANPRSPWHVHVSDLAAHLDKSRILASESWGKSQV